MKKIATHTVVLAVGLVAGIVSGLKSSPEVLFSPNGGCTAKIVSCLDGAKKDVKLAAYQLTHEDVISGLQRARDRGVKVEIVVDDSEKPKDIEKLGSVYVDSKHAIMHNKYIIIDGHLVLTGSFNYSINAEKHNAENLILIEDRGVAQKYLDNFELHKSHSKAPGS